MRSKLKYYQVGPYIMGLYNIIFLIYSLVVLLCFSLEPLNVTCPVRDCYRPSLMLMTSASHSQQAPKLLRQSFRRGSSHYILSQTM